MKRNQKGVVHIKNLFSSYQTKLIPPQASVVKVFASVVEEILHINIPKEKIEYQVSNQTIYLKVGGPVKSEVKLHETEILSHTRGRLGDRATPKQIV